MDKTEQTSTHIISRPAQAEWIPFDENGEKLIARLAEEMAQSWRLGNRVRVEAVLDAHRELQQQPEAVLDLIYEEICLGEELGEPARKSDLTRRFPTLQAQIEILVNCAHALQTNVLGGFPAPGDNLGDFCLVAEIGRGSQGRVFVATQTSLGDRPVVLKVTARGGQEHLSLARLQHTHIVPLLSMLEEPTRNLRGLCMPYFGGMTLAAILDGLKDKPQSARTGQQILDLLDKARADAVLKLPPGRDPATPFLGRASYVQAICWLGACLAEALKYAHERGLVHLDIKPSNVLLTADRQPMLLDFHLAQGVLRPGDLGMRFGGTPLYMSPEQKKTLAGIRRGEAIKETIDGRSDIYSLGLVLYEGFGGHVAADSTAPWKPLCMVNRAVSVGLSDIVGKCLADHPKNRYPDAGSLSADLWAHLNDASLKGVANRSWTERWQKWRRRRPQFFTLLGMAAAIGAVAICAILFAYVHVSQQTADANAALTDGKQFIQEQRYGDAVNALRRGLAQLENLPGNQDLKDALTQQLQAASGALVAQELHRIADRFRIVYGYDDIPIATLAPLDEQIRIFWDRRQEILDKLGESVHGSLREQVKRDLLDLAILESNLGIRLAKPGATEAAHRAALTMLIEAETLFGPSKALYHEQKVHALALGEAAFAAAAQQKEAATPARTAWDHYALGRALLFAKDYEAATQELEQAVHDEHLGLWPSFYQGICQYRLGRFVEAAQSFTISATLAPQTPACFYNRALAYQALGRLDLARLDCEHALKLDAGFTEAAQLLKSMQPS
jgi:tetratricopeptide (TPR) repeat protein